MTSVTDHPRHPLARPRSQPGAARAGWYAANDCEVEDLRALVETTTDLRDYPRAAQVVDNVLVYQASAVERAVDPAARRALQAEVAHALLDGPGVVAFTGAFAPDVVDAASEAFRRLIAEQRASGGAAGDHFAEAGANDRIWGGVGKLAVIDPQTFAEYYANDVLALVCEAWLGPDYQVTSQVNVVNPGGTAQVAHRDYHLGFMDRERAQAFPALAHALSPALTLQAGIAHLDMPVASGTTMLLPHSQKYPQGYVAYHDPAFTAYFNDHFVQLPLAKGDVVFFNPALFHGAGTNHTTDVVRMVNILQISSAFGRAMESEDSTAMCIAVYPVLQRWVAEGRPAQLIENLITATAEGYPFPTNLDRDQPLDAMAPQSQAGLLRQALAQGWDGARLAEALAAQADRRLAQAVC